jgi:large subunit ribosomal protein L9
MKVILLQDVPGLGKPGDVKEVAPGYARNYLLPRQLVTAATEAQLASLHERVAAAQRRLSKQRQTHEELASRLGDVALTFAVRVGQGGRLYGSVTSQNIADALREQEDLTVDRRVIQLREPLRALGEFDVGVRVATGVEPKIKVRIVSSDSVEAGGAAASNAADETVTIEPQEAEATEETEA